VTAEWLKRHINFEKTTEPYHDIIVRAYMEIFDWDENVIFPEVTKLLSNVLLINNYIKRTPYLHVLSLSYTRVT